jgi:type II secretory pathway component PulJ
MVEILVATTLMLLMMLAVAQVFGWMGESINHSRRTLEMTDRLRAAAARLQQDLQNVTVTMDPPRRPESNEGYFEYVEGPIGPVFDLFDRSKTPNDRRVFVNSDTDELDSTVIDNDDILMFTVRSGDKPFVGRFGNRTIESYTAEIAYFVRGRTLYRRVLLVAPETLQVLDTNRNGMIDPAEIRVFLNLAAGDPTPSFYNVMDLSARPEYFSASNETSWVPNTLGDLTKRENRYAHRVHANDVYPFSIIRWAQLELPILRECSHDDWMRWVNNTSYPTTNLDLKSPRDLWTEPHPWSQVEPVTGTLWDGTNSPNARYLGDRIGEDVLLTNVIGFDVKAWDPAAPILAAPTGDALLPGDPAYMDALLNNQPILGFGAYVDLNYMCRLGPRNGTASVGIQVPDYPRPGPEYANVPIPQFYAAGDVRSGVRGLEPLRANNIDITNGHYWRQSVYDTWSFHYEHDGIDEGNYNQVPPNSVDEGTNGFDDNNDGIVDDPGELEAPPPYPVPLRGIQIKLRTFEPDSRQVREVTVVQDFLAK